MLTADRSSYFVRLGDLAPSFRQRAFEHALSHLQHGQFQARAALAQLEDSFKLVRAFPSPQHLPRIAPQAPPATRGDHKYLEHPSARDLPAQASHTTNSCNSHHFFSTLGAGAGDTTSPAAAHGG